MMCLLVMRCVPLGGSVCCVGCDVAVCADVGGGSIWRENTVSVFSIVSRVDRFSGGA